MKKIFLLPAIAVIMSFTACVDLRETYYSEISQSKLPPMVRLGAVYQTVRGNITGTTIAAPWWKYVYCVQVASDEICIPVQLGTDITSGNSNWYDGGVYVDMQKHTWNPENVIFLSCWNYYYTIIGSCNALLGDLGRETLDNNPMVEADLKLLRAYSYYQLMDLFGNVPLMTEEHIGQAMSEKMPRKDLFAWIEGQLEDPVMQALRTKSYGSMTKGVLGVLKARLYLNANVYLGEPGFPLSDGNATYRNYLEKVITACEDVEGLGYDVERNIFANWYIDNGSSNREIIWGIQYLGDGSAEGNDLQMESYPGPNGNMDLVFGDPMYSHCPGGFVLNPGKYKEDPKALFNLFSDNDNRRLSILYGQAYERSSKATAYWGVWARNDVDNPGLGIELYGGGQANAGRPPMRISMDPFFERGFEHSNNRQTSALPRVMGARLIKFELEDAPLFYTSKVDMVEMRFTEALYSKAEALIRLGRAGEALPIFQKVLSSRGFDPNDDSKYNKDYPLLDWDLEDQVVSGVLSDTVVQVPTVKKVSAVALMSKRWLNPTDLLTYEPAFLSNINLDFMEKEWRREFIFERRRRTDMIRFGSFLTETWGGHLNPTNDPNKTIFPIPQSILAAQPKVKQNPGY